MKINENKESLALYVHIPFCESKCGYCDFLSSSGDKEVRNAYVDSLLEEIKIKAKQYKMYSVPSIFIGGGTPSVLSEKSIRNIMETIFMNFNMEKQAEITIECNPNSLTCKKLEVYKESGINRISLGLQSAQDEELKLLGRIHSYEDFLKSMDLIRKHEFFNVNVDLMYGIPGQTVKSFQDTLTKIINLRPEHISAYSLIIEEGTPFYEKYIEDELGRQNGQVPIYLPYEEVENEMYETAKRLLTDKGYQYYEISNYAKPGKECRHNICYWTRGNYLGLGLGSSSLVNEVRFKNTDDLEQYKGRTFKREDIQMLGRKNQIEEFMFLGLRMRRGVSRLRFKEIFRLEIESVYGELIKMLVKQELLEQKEGDILLTEYGISVSNFVLAKFLLED